MTDFTHIIEQSRDEEGKLCLSRIYRRRRAVRPSLELRRDQTSAYYSVILRVEETLRSIEIACATNKKKEEQVFRCGCSGKRDWMRMKSIIVMKIDNCMKFMKDRDKINGCIDTYNKIESAKQ